MRKILYSLIFIIITININAQSNLVPNYSFEYYVSCPHNGSLIDTAAPWFNGNTGDADYFNACDGSGTSTVGVPENAGGFQNARTGDAYSGIFAYIHSSGFPYDRKEYLEVKLDSVLTHDRKYCVHFYVSLANPSFVSYNNVSITEIGMYFSDTLVYDSVIVYDPLPFTPQVVSPPGVFLSDTANWMEISGSYIANGGEQYIVIGNFKPFGQTDTMGVVNTSSMLNQAYYFIDDVSVVDCTGIGITELEVNTSIDVFPNPTSGIININYKLKEDAELIIYDITGRILKFQVLDSKQQQAIINASELASGSYYYRITVNNETRKAGKIVIIK